jgi:hypothetical protein
MKKTILLFVVLTIISCSSESRNTSVSDTMIIQQNKTQSPGEKYTFKIIPVVGNTFGYEISDLGKIIVLQKTIPSLPGNSGFRSKADAEKCARLVISKLNRNIMPPAVTPKEIDSLGIRTNPDTHQHQH